MKQYKQIKEFLSYKEVGKIWDDDGSRSRWFNRRHFRNKEYFKEVLPIKTIRERLQELPDGYRELAMQYENSERNRREESIYSCLTNIGSFDWEKTREWVKFRDNVSEHYARWTPLPPLPQKGRWKPDIWCWYYYVMGGWVILQSRYDGWLVDKWHLMLWNCFQTEEQAKAYKYLVMHEQRLADNWHSLKLLYHIRPNHNDDEVRPMSTSPSKWIVPSDREDKKVNEHTNKLRLVYWHLFT